jgi:uncharacterized membrane protein
MLNGAMTPRIRPLLVIARYLLAALFVKVLVSILIEYRWYFPADFDSAFLTGREKIFHGLYATAFYVHVVTGPMTVVLAALLMWSRGRTGYRSLHRWAGRSQALLVLGALVPSGLVMTRHAFAGPIAAVGFMALSLITATCMAAAVYYACARQFSLHQRWATRCFLALISPLILRVVSGGLIVTHLDTPLAYCLNAWLSWLIPLALYEGWWRYRAIASRRVPVRLSVQLTLEVSP